jgi:chemotaxis protein methyltransferase CheR
VTARTNAPQGQASPQPAPPWLIANQPELSDREFADFCRLIHRHAGIHLPAQKKELVRGRLVKLLRARGLSSFSAYYGQVLEDKSGGELAQLLDAISTNQTAFWREPAHFLFLCQEILPHWRQQRRHGMGWRFWSAGCSSGEEPYTLAMVLLEALPAAEVKNIKIYASDLSTQVLAQAQQGIYPEARVAPLPAEWRRRFFQKGQGKFQGSVRLKAEVRGLVHFFHLNLMDPGTFHEELDLIFCRNVMIYFDKQTQAAVVEKLYRALRPGGYLFLGHSESLCNLRHRFSYVKPTVYRK